MNIAAAMIAIAVGLFSAVTIYQVQKFKWRSEGAQQQMSRVEQQERKIDAKIQKRVRGATGKPTDSMLSKWERP